MIRWRDIAEIVSEYHVKWIFYRSLYAIKLQVLNKIPASEGLFERKVEVKRILPIRLNHKKIEEFLEHLPDKEKSKIIQATDRAIEGKIKGFSSVLLDYGKPIRWNYSPMTGCDVDVNLKWYKIPDFHKERGDIKVVWEASRFSHFYLFARAYALTKNRKYYEAFSGQLADWLDNNPYGYGANYKCGQECSLRMLNALMTYSFFKEYALTTESDENAIKDLIDRSYRKVLSNFFYAHKCIRNNHTLSELCGMIVGAWCCEDEKQLKKGYVLLNKEIDWQFFDDGGYRQYSYTYQRLALQLMEFLLKIEPITERTITNRCKEKIIRSAELLYQLQNKDGDVPNYGSNDGALIFPVHSASYRDFRPIVDSIFKNLKKEAIYSGGIFEEEALWFSNEENWVRKEIPKESVYKEKSGIYVINNQNSLAVLYASKYDSRPAQMDELHFDLWVNDINIFCDSGTFSYASLEGRKLALTEAHNTVKVHGKEQMKKKGAFLIYGWPKCDIQVLENTKIQGKMTSVNGYVHQRLIQYEKNIYTIIDTVDAKEGHEVLFHTPCKVLVEKNMVHLFVGEQEIAKLIAEDNMEIEISPCDRSLFYLKKETINMIKLKPKKGEAITKIVIATKEND
ncbi:heparinase II/III domain-containing protein [Clostridium sp.]